MSKITKVKKTPLKVGRKPSPYKSQVFVRMAKETKDTLEKMAKPGDVSTYVRALLEKHIASS